MRLSSDDVVLWHHGFVKLNETIVTTWALMLAMTAGAGLITRRLSTGPRVSRWQSGLEILVTAMKGQAEEIGLRSPAKYLPFLGSLFLFVAVSNAATLLPGYEPPTGSLSTTAALAICVGLAVPLFGLRERGFTGYLRTYLDPTPVMLPFNLLSEMTRTLALAVRLFGNIMSGSMIVAILLTIAPFLFPAAMSALGLLTGMVQAYIFTILAAVYIAAATTTKKD